MNVKYPLPTTEPPREPDVEVLAVNECGNYRTEQRIIHREDVDTSLMVILRTGVPGWFDWIEVVRVAKKDWGDFQTLVDTTPWREETLFDSFADAYRNWLSHQCDSPGTVCECLSTFPCPQCGHVLHISGESMPDQHAYCGLCESCLNGVPRKE